MQIRLRDRKTNSRSVVRPAVSTEDTKRTAATRGTAERREPKRGGINNRESERSDSTVEVGELALSEDPVEGNPSASFPDQMESWDRLKAAYRLFDAAGVTFDAIASPHWEHTRQRADGRTLVICDTTELDFGSQRQIEGVSRTGNGSGQGFLLHNAMMVSVETMSVIGIGGQTIHYRPKERIPKTENRSQRLARDRESQVWGRVIEPRPAHTKCL